MKIFNRTFDVLERSMDLRFKRHAVLSGNVANSETPNYRAREVSFADELERIVGQDVKSLTKTDAKHMDISSVEGAHITYDDSGMVGADGNNVDLDISMGKLAENARSYGGSVNLIGLQLRLLKNAARGRGA